MEITACPNCGSRNIFQGRLGEGVLTGYTTRSVCRDCGYQGMPIIFDSEKEYKKFLEGISIDKKSIDKIEEETKKEKKPLKHERPLGVTILAFIMILDAIFTICLYYSLIGPHIPSLLWAYYIAILLVSAVILPYGILKGKGWAWTIGAILYALSIPIGLVFLYYLTRPHVRAYFGKI